MTDMDLLAVIVGAIVLLLVCAGIHLANWNEDDRDE